MLDMFSSASSFTAAPDSLLCCTNPQFSHPQPLPSQITPTLTHPAVRFNPPLKRFQARFKLPRKSPHSSIPIILGYMLCWLNSLNRNMYVLECECVFIPTSGGKPALPCSHHTPGSPFSLLCSGDLQINLTKPALLNSAAQSIQNSFSA